MKLFSRMVSKDIAEAMWAQRGALLEKDRLRSQTLTATILFSDLLVHHVTAHSRRDRNARVGCTWQGMPPAAEERLLEWIERGRRRRDMMSLNLS